MFRFFWIDFRFKEWCFFLGEEFWEIACGHFSIMRDQTSIGTTHAFQYIHVCKQAKRINSGDQQKALSITGLSAPQKDGPGTSTSMSLQSCHFTAFTRLRTRSMKKGGSLMLMKYMMVNTGKCGYLHMVNKCQ